MTVRKHSTTFGMGIAFGALFTAATSAVSTTERDVDVENIIQQTTSAAVSAVVTELERREERRLESMPDVLDCNSFSWMNKCEVINKQAKQNPTSHIRVMSKDGVEFNFPPGTSSAEMAHLLNNDEASTRAYVQSLDKAFKHHTAAAERYTKMLWAQGGFKNLMSTEEYKQKSSQPLETVDTDKVAVSIFYSSTCPTCKTTLRNISVLKEKYPTLSITAFQTDDAPDGPSYIKERYGIPARALSETEKQQIRERGVTGVPTVWIDNRANKHRSQRQGPLSLSVLEAELEQVSLFVSDRG